MYTPGANNVFPHRIVEEYRWRVRHNFKQYMYLGLKSGRWEQDRILKEIWNAPGYAAYKIIKYSSLWSHIYVKFQTDIAASEAVDYFRNLDGNLNAELVDNLLCSWYIYENLTGYIGEFTAAVVDAVGDPPQCMNPMLEPILATVLKDFGAPHVLIIQENTAQVVFTSMAEALGACIAHGKWLTNLKFSHLYYRVKIIGTGKELGVIGKYLSQDNVPTTGAQEAFKLDYFADPEELRTSPIRDYLNQFSSHIRDVRSVIPRQPSGVRQDRRHRRITNNATPKEYSNHPRGSGQAMFLNPNVCNTGFPNNLQTVVFNDFGAPLGTMVFRNGYGNNAHQSISYSAIPTIMQETDYDGNEDLNSPLISEHYSYEYFNSFEVGSETTPQFSCNIGSNYNLSAKQAERARVDMEFNPNVPKEQDAISAVVCSEVSVGKTSQPALHESDVSRSCPQGFHGKITAPSRKVPGTAAEHRPPAVRSRDTEIPTKCPEASPRTEFRNSKRTSAYPQNRGGYRRK